jgi:hypothetical protein
MTEFFKSKFQKKVLIHKNDKNRETVGSSCRIAIDKSQTGTRVIIPKPQGGTKEGLREIEKRKLRKREKL